MTAREMTKDEWAAAVYAALAAHPDWAAATVEAMQAGILEAIDRQKDRTLKVSLGLVEALNSQPGAKKRDGQRIIDAIEVSQFHPTPWSAKMIEREATS